MDAYFDYTNFCSYLATYEKSDFRECNDVLRSQFNRRFTFNRDHLLEIKDPKIKRNFDLWTLNNAANRRGTVNDWNASFPVHPIDSAKFLVADPEHPDKLNSIYMLDGNDASSLAYHGALLVAKPGQELEVINNLRVREEDFQDVEIYPARELKDWSIVNQFASPCTDIIIADPWIFMHGKDPHRLYKNNVYAILDSLARYANDIALNIVFVTETIEKDGSEKLDVRQIISEIKDLIAERVGRVPKVTFVRPWQLHDRYIITNYKWITSSHTFTYFEEDGKNFTTGESLHIHAAYSPKKRELQKQLIASVQAEINARRASVIGDRVSNFLNFPDVSDMPKEGEIVHLKRDEDNNVVCDCAIAPFSDFGLDITDEELEHSAFVIRKVMENTKARTKDRYPYFIYVKKVES